MQGHIPHHQDYQGSISDEVEQEHSDGGHRHMPAPTTNNLKGRDAAQYQPMAEFMYHSNQSTFSKVSQIRDEIMPPAGSSGMGSIAQGHHQHQTGTITSSTAVESHHQGLKHSNPMSSLVSGNGAIFVNKQGEEEEPDDESVEQDEVAPSSYIAGEVQQQYQHQITMFQEDPLARAHQFELDDRQFKRNYRALEEQVANLQPGSQSHRKSRFLFNLFTGSKKHFQSCRSQQQLLAKASSNERVRSSHQLVKSKGSAQSFATLKQLSKFKGTSSKMRLEAAAQKNHSTLNSLNSARGGRKPSSRNSRRANLISGSIDLTTTQKLVERLDAGSGLLLSSNMQTLNHYAQRDKFNLRTAEIKLNDDLRSSKSSTAINFSQLSKSQMLGGQFTFSQKPPASIDSKVAAQQRNEFHQRQKQHLQEKEVKIDCLKKQIEDEEISECTFKPMTNQWRAYNKAKATEELLKRNEDMQNQAEMRTGNKSRNSNAPETAQRNQRSTSDCLKSGEVGTTTVESSRGLIGDQIQKFRVQPMNIATLEEKISNHSLRESVNEASQISSLIKGEGSIADDSHGKSVQVKTEKVLLRPPEISSFQQEPVITDGRQDQQDLPNEGGQAKQSVSTMLEGKESLQQELEIVLKSVVYNNNTSKKDKSLKKKKSMPVGPPKPRSRERFLHDQKQFEQRKKSKIKALKERLTKEEEKTAPFQPSIGKISKVLGEISIQQHFKQQPRATSDERSAAANTSPGTASNRIYEKLYDQAMQKQAQRDYLEIEINRRGSPSFPEFQRGKLDNLASSAILTNKSVQDFGASRGANRSDFPTPHSISPQLTASASASNNKPRRNQQELSRSLSKHKGDSVCKRHTQEEGVGFSSSKQKHSESKTQQNPQQKLNPKSMQYFINRFTKEIISVWQECPSSVNSKVQEGVFLDEINRQNETMNTAIFSYMLRKLGYLLEHQEMADSAESHYVQSKLVDLWKVLGGEYYGHVTLNNLRIMLLAIKGLHVQPDVKIKKKNLIRLGEQAKLADSASKSGDPLGLEGGLASGLGEGLGAGLSAGLPGPTSPVMEEEKEDTEDGNGMPTPISNIEIRKKPAPSPEPSTFSYFGSFNENGDLLLFSEDIERALKQFDKLKQNRMISEQQLLLQRKEQRTKVNPHTFKPKISSSNKQLAKKSWSRQQSRQKERPNEKSSKSTKSAGGRKSPLINRLQQPTVTQQWREEQLLKQEEETKKQCTFQPQIYRSKSRNEKKLKASEYLHQANTSFNSRRHLIYPPEMLTVQHEDKQGPHQSLELQAALTLDLSKVLRNQDPYKFKSKDLMESSGDRNTNLYHLQQKIDFVKPKRDKSTDEIDFQKSKEECTFQPNVATINGSHKYSVTNLFSVNQLHDSSSGGPFSASRQQHFSKQIRQQEVAQSQQVVSNLSGTQSIKVQDAPLGLDSENTGSGQIQISQLSILNKGNRRQQKHCVHSKVKGADKSIERMKKSTQDRKIIQNLKEKGLFLNSQNVKNEATKIKEKTRVVAFTLTPKPKTTQGPSKRKSTKRSSVQKSSKKSRGSSKSPKQYSNPLQKAVQQLTTAHTARITKRPDFAAAGLTSNSARTKPTSSNQENITNFTGEQIVEQHLEEKQTSMRNEINHPVGGFIAADAPPTLHGGVHFDEIYAQEQEIEKGAQESRRYIENEDLPPEDPPRMSLNENPFGTCKDGDPFQKPPRPSSQEAKKEEPQVQEQMFSPMIDDMYLQMNQDSSQQLKARAEVQKLDEDSSLDMKNNSQGSFPLLSIEVNITPHNSQKLHVYRGDDPIELASHFCEEHGLPAEMKAKLETLLEAQIQAALIAQDNL